MTGSPDSTSFHRPRRKPTRLSWFPFYVDDWTGGTSSLSGEEVGHYIRILMAQWQSQGRQAVPFDRVRLILHGETPSAAVLSKFETVDESGHPCYRNSRLAGEWRRAADEHEAKSGGGRRSLAKTLGKTLTQDSRATTHNPQPTEHTPTSQSPENGSPIAALSEQKPIEDQTSQQAVVTVWMEEGGSIGKKSTSKKGRVTYRGGMSPSRIVQALIPLFAEHGREHVLRNWRRYCRERETEFMTPEDFASKYRKWSKGRKNPKAEAKDAAMRAGVAGGLRGKR